MATVDELVTIIEEAGFEDTSTVNKIFWLNEAYADVLGREPWPFLEKAVTFTWDGSDSTPTNVPADFKAVDAIVDTEYPRELFHKRWKDIQRLFGDDITDSNDPLYYYFLAGAISFWPVPLAGNTTVKMTYLADWTELAAGGAETTILIPPKFHHVLVPGTLKSLYLQDDDPELSVAAEQRFEKKLYDMRADLWKRDYSRAETIEEVDPEYYY